MKPEELIKNNALQNRVVPEEIAITAVNLARKEEQELAFNVLEFILDEWIDSGYAEGLLNEFKDKLEEKK